MVGYRKTHDFPQGRPFPLVLLGIGMAVVLLAWVFLVPGHWPRAIWIIAVFVALAFIDAKLHTLYERTGQAVRIPRPKILTRFSHGLPVPMLIARSAFFVTVALMILFGVAPFADSTARIGIIVCVFVLIGIAALNVGLERYYGHTGVAQEFDVSSGGNAKV
jgi:hypothetical protein